MRSPRTDALRRSLQLSIDAAGPYAYRPSVSETTPSPISSTRASIATSTLSWSTATDDGPPGGADDARLCTVRCLYDFASADPDHLPFRAGELLDVVRQEDTGWWAALRRDGGLRVGWIPSAFVQVVAQSLPAEPVRTRDDVSVWGPEDDVEDGNIPRFSHGSMRSSEWSQSDDEADPIMDAIAPGVDKRRESFLPPYEADPPVYISSTPTYPFPVPDLRPTREQYPPTPDAPMPLPIPPPLDTSPLYSQRAPPPTPSTPPSRSIIGSIREHPLLLRPSSSTSLVSRQSSTPSRSLPSPSISVVTSGLAHRARHSASADSDDGRSSASMRSPRSSKVRQITGEDVAERLVSTRAHQATLPWYLRTAYAEDELKMESDGVVKMGTLPALVDRLTAEPVSPQQEQTYRNVFLTTFRTFAKPVDVFALLVDQYEMNHPPNLADGEFDDWKARKLRPTQRRVLKVMDEWLEHHDMLQEEPQVARQLQHFLGLVKSPPEMVQFAQSTLKTLERLTFAPSSPPVPAISANCKPRKKFKLGKNELVKMDVTALAQHITMLEWRLFSRIKEQECLNWAHTQHGSSVARITAFCATHDRLATWVKHTVLANDGLGKRADMVDFWIKVAEKCRHFNNFSSTTAIVAGLASTVISKLHLTWAHVSRASHLEPLVRLNEPAGHFGAYRATLAAVDGPCVPFIGGFLSDIVHIQDELEDPPAQPGHFPVVHFGKRRRWADAVRSIMRHQAHTYTFAEDAHTVAFVEKQIADAVSRDPAFFWSRSQELQAAELAHADIRKGLEAAGF